MPEPKTNKQKKEFEHEIMEVCRLSQKKINTYDERYAIILDCDGDQITSIGFYKSGRLKDLIQGKAELVKKDLVERYKDVASSMLSKILPQGVA